MTQLVVIPETEVTEDMIRYSMPGDCCAGAISLTILESTGLFPVIWDNTAHLFKTKYGQDQFADLRHDDDKYQKVEENQFNVSESQTISGNGLCSFIRNRTLTPQNLSKSLQPTLAS